MAVASGEADYARPIKSGEIDAPVECRPAGRPVSSRRGRFAAGAGRWALGAGQDARRHANPAAGGLSRPCPAPASTSRLPPTAQRPAPSIDPSRANWSNARAMARFKLTLEYAGTRYSGWQIQKNARTVAGEIDRAVR